MKILVIGGAGYIGSHMLQYLDRIGWEAVTLDNLSLGHVEAVKTCPLIVGDLSNQELVTEILGDYHIDVVMHFAAFALVSESVSDPAKYYQNNVAATLNLLEAMRRTDVQRLVFSSTCATYGIPDRLPIDERQPQRPVNPYGFTKLVIEQALSDYCHAYGLGYAALRYFNAAGAATDGSLGEDHDPETHLIPIILQTALGQRSHVTVYGDDWETVDGTCVRDYIHVEDLAVAHARAAERIKPGEGLQVNLGTGMGYSVSQVIDFCRQVTGREIPVLYGPRRAGDPAELVADPRKAQSLLNWQPQQSDLETIVATAWNWHRHHPQGYRSTDPSDPLQAQSSVSDS